VPASHSVLGQASEAQIGHHSIYCSLCSGPRRTVDNLLSYVLKIFQRFAASKVFTFVWTNSVSHDPDAKARNGDESYANFISKLELNNTALFVLGDHGVLYGRESNSYQVCYLNW
jgi:hypothetical protein